MTYSSRIEGGWTCDGGVGVVFGHIVVVVQAVIRYRLETVTRTVAHGGRGNFI